MGSCSIFLFSLACFRVASSYPTLLSEVHELVDAHFRYDCYGINLYFCEFEDAVEHIKRFARNSTDVSKRVKCLKYMEREDDLQVKKFTHRASVFLDTSCAEGLQLLNRSVLKMDFGFRWLIFSEDTFSVLKILESSRLELNSDVTLIAKQNDNTLKYSRLSRVHYKLRLALTANYSVQDTKENEELSKAVFWRGEEINFGNYSFDACTVFLDTKHRKLEEWPLLLNNSVERGVEEFRRYFSHVVWYLMETYNFTINLADIKDWGIIQPNGSFSGAFGLVERGEIDFGVTAVRPELERFGSMDFSFSIATSRFIFILTQLKTFGTPSALIVPFQSTTWLVFLVLVLVLICAMRISILSDREQLHNDSWGGSILLVFGGISQNGIPDYASKFSSRTVHMVTLMSLFIIYLYYSTAVLNGLILPSPDPIQNIEQLIASDTKLGAQDIIYIRRELLLVNDSTTLRVRQKLIPKPFLPVEEGLWRVKNGRFALYGLDISLETAMKDYFTQEERCLISEIQMIRRFQLCYFLKKGSPFKEIMNRGLIKIIERGIASYLKEYWLVQKPKCTVSLLFAPIKYQGMTLAYGVYAVGLLICLIVAIVEVVFGKMMRKRTQKRTHFFVSSF